MTSDTMINPDDVYYPQTLQLLPSLAGKNYAITGTTSGTGFYAAKGAIQKNAACVILLNRPSPRSILSERKLKEFATEQGSTTRIYNIDCDLQDFASVRRAADQINAHTKQFGGIDALLNNAGLMGVPDFRTKDGYDVQMQTNHLSHFLLTHLLLPSLELAAATRGEARVVQHSSGARGKHRAPDGKGVLKREFFSRVASGELGGDGLGACFNRYHQTKLSNSVFGMALHHLFQSQHSKVKSIVAEPGVAKTDLSDNLAKGHKMAGVDLDFTKSAGASYPGIQSAADGACCLMIAGFGRSNHVDSGDFFMPGSVVKKTVVGMPVKCMTAGLPTPTHSFMRKHFDNEKLTMDVENHHVLWTMSEQATGITWARSPSSRM